MITPSFSLTATERVLPRMALDFTTASLDSRVTFTRTGNTATVINSSGFVTPINADLPRFDYDPITLVCKGLLIEESRTNILPASEQFNNAVYWTVSNSTIVGDAATSPGNTLTADKLVADATTNFHYVVRTDATLASTTYALSVYAKAAEQTQIYVAVAGTNWATSGFCTVDLTNGSVISGAATVTAMGSGWYRISVLGTTDATVNFRGLLIATAVGGNPSYNGTTYTGGVYIWGAQMEAGAFVTSYIPTVASQVTRTADVAIMTGTNFSSWYTATTGAAVVWAIPQAITGVRPLIQFDDTTALKIITLRGNVADPELYIVDTVAQAQIDAGTIVANTAYKLSGGWDTNNCAAAKDGGTVGTDVVATIPAPTQLRIGSDGTNYASAWVQKVMYWKQRIINAEVQAFSK